MAKGITEEDVTEAADALLSAGQRPTIERVRLKLGRGSPNTVNRHLDTWWTGLAKRVGAGSEESGAPKEVLKLANRLWERAVATAQASETGRLEGLSTELKAFEEKLNKQRQALVQRGQVLTEVVRVLRDQVKQQQTELKAKDSRIRDLESNLLKVHRGPRLKTRSKPKRARRHAG